MFFVESNGSGGRLLVDCVPIREQSSAKLTLNNVFVILKLIPLFTESGQKVTLSNVANYKTYSLTSAAYVCCTNTVHINFYKSTVFAAHLLDGSSRRFSPHSCNGVARVAEV